MVYTSSHNSCETENYKTYAISGNRGVDADYRKSCYKALAPKYGFWKEWHDNIGKVDELENDEFYIERYFLEVLEGLDPFEEYMKLNDSVLLCYEDNLEFCHRHIIAAWFNLYLGVEVPEVSIRGEEVQVKSRPTYIAESLEKIIRKYYGLGSHESIHAFYLRCWADKLKEENSNVSELLRRESNEIEEPFVLSKKNK